MHTRLVDGLWKELGVARWRTERDSRNESSNYSQASHLQGLDTTGGEDVPPRFGSDVLR